MNVRMKMLSSLNLEGQIKVSCTQKKRKSIVESFIFIYKQSDVREHDIFGKQYIEYLEVTEKI